MYDQEEKIIDRLISYYQSAGKPTANDWYKQANLACLSLSNKYGLEIETIAAVVAALSPRVPWRSNLAGADTIIGAFLGGANPESVFRAVAGFSANKRKAWAILAENNPALLSGQKVTNFYFNILGHQNGVTIDTWMITAMLGLPINQSKDNLMNVTPKRYAFLAQCLNKAAALAGLPAVELQAVVWMQIRRQSDIQHIKNE